MAGATYAKYKTWAPNEDLTTADLNAHIDNERENLNPPGMDDYSENVSQMQIQTDPGSEGAESKATSLAGELERIRFAISRSIGGPFWYTTPPTSLSEINDVISVPRNRIISGRVRGTVDGRQSNQPIFLQPDGTTPNVSLLAATDNFVVRINNQLVTFTTDVVSGTLLTALAAGPTTQCTVSGLASTGTAASRYAGEEDSDEPVLPVSTMGANISSLIGQYAAFRVGAEYFIAYVKSTTELTKCFRGFFFDASDNPIPRVQLTNGNTITLMRLTWIFANDDGVLISPVYTNPAFSATAPSPATFGDYWYDLTVNEWKIYNGASFISANANLIGVCVQDSAGCKAARSFEFFADYRDRMTSNIERTSNTQFRTATKGAVISVAGVDHSFAQGFASWDMPADIESGVEAANTEYFGYVTDYGLEVLSTERPYGRESDLFGKYHPYHPWRAVGSVTNDGSSNFSVVNDYRVKRRSAITADAVAPQEGIAIGTPANPSGNANAVFSTLIGLVTTERPKLRFRGRPIKVDLGRGLLGSPAYLLLRSGNTSVTPGFDMILERELNLSGVWSQFCMFQFRADVNAAGANRFYHFAASSIHCLDYEVLTVATAGDVVSYRLQGRVVNGAGAGANATLVSVVNTNIVAYDQ